MIAVLALTIAAFALTLGVTPLVYLPILLSLAYSAGFESRFGATPGKMVFGLKVRMANGGPVTLQAGVGRYFGHWVSAMMFGIGFLMIGFTPQKRGLHDLMAGTIVVHERSETSTQPAS